MALLLSADEALDRLPAGSGEAPAGPALARSIGAIGTYLLHACALANLQLGEVVAEHLEREEGDLPEAARSAR